MGQPSSSLTSPKPPSSSLTLPKAFCILSLEGIPTIIYIEIVDPDGIIIVDPDGIRLVS